MDQNHSKLKTKKDLYTFCEQANVTQLVELTKKEVSLDDRSLNIALRKAINNFDNKNPNFEGVFEILLTLDINLNYQDAQDDKNENSTIIDLLCMKGNLDLIKLILQPKNDRKSFYFNNKKINFSLIDSNKQNLFHYLLSQSIIEKQELDAVEIFNYFFNEYSKINSSSKNEFIKLLQKPDNNGNDALAIALLNGWYKITQLILQQILQQILKYGTLTQICNSDGNNYIHCAIKGNNIKCLKVILYYSDLKHLEDKNNDKLTPLKLAENKGSMYAVKLIEHFKMNYKKKVYKDNFLLSNVINQLNPFALLKLYHNKEYEKTGYLIEQYKLMENIKYQYVSNCNNIINENYPNNISNNIGTVQLNNNNSNSSLFSSYEGENISIEWNLLLIKYKQICNKSTQINSNNINTNGTVSNHKNNSSSTNKKHKNANNNMNNNSNASSNTNNNNSNNIHNQCTNSLFPLFDEMKTFFNKYLNNDAIKAYYQINDNNNNNTKDTEMNVNLNQSILPLDILIFNKIIFFLRCNDIYTVLETIEIYFTIVYPSNNKAYYKWITFINISLIFIEILITYNYTELASKLIEIIDKLKQPTLNVFINENIKTYLNEIEVFTQKTLEETCYYINLLKIMINIENDNKNEYEKLIDRSKYVKVYPIFNKLQKCIEIKRNYFLNNKMKCFTNIEKCKNEENKIFYYNTLGILNIKLKKYAYAELQFRNALNVYSKLIQRNRKNNENVEIRIDFIYMLKFNLGLTWFLRKEYEKAKNIFISLTKAQMFNKNFYLWYRLGLCYLEMELNTQAKNDKGYNDLIKDIKGYESKNKKEQNRININLSQENEENEILNENVSPIPNTINNKNKDKYYNSNTHNNNSENEDLDDLYIQFEREYGKNNISSLTTKQTQSPPKSQQKYTSNYNNTNINEESQYDSNDFNTQTYSHKKFIIRDYNYSTRNSNSMLYNSNYNNKKSISCLSESISAFKQCIIIANNSILRKPILNSIHDFYMKLNKNEDFINKNNTKIKDTFQNDYSTSFSHRKENLLPIINAYLNLLFALTLKEEWLQILFYIKEFRSHNFQISNEINIKIKSFHIEALIHLRKYTQVEEEINSLLKLYQNENYRFNYYCRQNTYNYSDIHFKAGLYYNLCLVSLKKNKIKEAEEYIKLIYSSYTSDKTYLPGYLVHLIVYINLIKYNNYKQKGDLIEDSISKKNKYIKNAIALIKTRRGMAVPKFYNGH